MKKIYKKKDEIPKKEKQEKSDELYHSEDWGINEGKFKSELPKPRYYTSEPHKPDEPIEKKGKGDKFGRK